jgi:hypothetical protein
MTVGEMEDRMGARELSRWMLYEVEDPFLADRIDLAGGLISSTMANIHRGKTTPPFVPLDFMPLAQRTVEVARVEAHRRANLPAPEDEEDAMVQRMVAVFGGGMNG